MYVALHESNINTDTIRAQQDIETFNKQQQEL
jgi:hypothetical protein